MTDVRLLGVPTCCTSEFGTTALDSEGGGSGCGTDGALSDTSGGGALAVSVVSFESVEPVKPSCVEVLAPPLLLMVTSGPVVVVTVVSADDCAVVVPVDGVV